MENFDPKLKESELRDFFMQFQVLVEAGIPIVLALESLSRSDQPRIGLVAGRLASDITKGCYVSRAMARFPESFDSLTVNAIRIGEKSGRLTLSMRRLAEVFEWRMRVKQQLTEALAYPVCVVSLSFVLVLFLSSYMLPNIVPLLTSLDVTLPLPTRILLFLTQQNWLMLALLALGLLLLADQLWGSGERQQKARCWFLYSSPVLGRINRTRGMARLCNELAMLTEVGLSLVEGLRTQGVVAPDPRLRDALSQAYRDVRMGKEVGPALAAQGYIYPIVSSSLTTGLETGRLPQSLTAAASLLNVEADAATDRLLQTLEPLALLILGGIVGGILLACFLPIYSLISSGI